MSDEFPAPQGNKTPFAPRSNDLESFDMAIIESQKLSHWNFFLAVEEDLHQLSRFIEFTADNFETHSLELARILFAAAAEVDVVAKQLCKQFVPGSHASKMNEYGDLLAEHLPVLGEAKTAISRHGLTFQPWTNLQERSVPDWWRAYNDVKHPRHERYKSANLKNAMNAVAGLFLITLFHCNEEATSGQLKPNPVLFRLGEPLGDDTLFWDSSKAIVYRLDKNRIL